MERLTEEEDVNEVKKMMALGEKIGIIVHDKSKGEKYLLEHQTGGMSVLFHGFTLARRRLLLLARLYDCRFANAHRNWFKVDAVGEESMHQILVRCLLDPLVACLIYDDLNVFWYGGWSVREVLIGIQGCFLCTRVLLCTKGALFVVFLLLFSRLLV